jgi:hypothetical protein
MCFTLSKIAPHDRWNWDGDHIIHECIVPASRPVPGYPPKKSSYDIDVREFLVSERNEVMRKTLRKDIQSFVQTTPGANWELFQSRPVRIHPVFRLQRCSSMGGLRSGSMSFIPGSRASKQLVAHSSAIRGGGPLRSARKGAAGACPGLVCAGASKSFHENPVRGHRR